MKKIALDSIKDDNLWVFKTDYQNTDLPWLELITQCIHFNSTECISYLIEDMDFPTLDDYVNCLNEAVQQQQLGSLGYILKESEVFGLFQYLAVISAEQQQEILHSLALLIQNDSDVESYILKGSKSFTLLDCLKNIPFEQQRTILHHLISIGYPIDWEELFDSGVTVHEDLIKIAERANFSLSNLVDYITYLLNSSGKELDTEYYSQLMKVTIKNADVISLEDVSAVFDTLVNRYIGDDEFVVMLGKCEPETLNTMLLDDYELSEEHIEVILSSFSNKVCGAVITKNIDLTAQLIESDPSFAQSIISHRDFEFDTDEKTGDEYQSWEWSIARCLFLAKKFEAIRVLVELGVKFGSFIKLYIHESSDWQLAESLFDKYCKEDDYQRFYLEVQDFIDHGLLTFEQVLTFDKGDTGRFDLTRLSKIF